MVVESREKRRNRAVPVRFAPNSCAILQAPSLQGFGELHWNRALPFAGASTRRERFSTRTTAFDTLNLAGPMLAPDGFQGLDDLAQSRGTTRRPRGSADQVSVLRAPASSAASDRRTGAESRAARNARKRSTCSCSIGDPRSGAEALRLPSSRNALTPTTSRRPSSSSRCAA